jgi:hypothetical protein
MQRRKGHDTVTKALPSAAHLIVKYIFVGMGEELITLYTRAQDMGTLKRVVCAWQGPDRQLAAHSVACEEKGENHGSMVR